MTATAAGVHAGPLDGLDAWELRRVLRTLRIVSERAGIEPSAVVGRAKTRRESEARHRAMFALHHYAGLSWAMIGRIFGRDHSSVSTAVRFLEHRRRVDPELLDELDALKAELKA